MFLDMAWDIESISEKTVKQYMVHWAAREFGTKIAKPVASLMDEYYRLAFLRKPEFMGWSQTEPTTKTKSTQFNIQANGNESD